MNLATVTSVYHELAKRDDELQQQINESFTRNAALPLRHVRVEVHEGLAVLRGSVRRYYDKQLAQELVKKIVGVETVRNEIVVNC